MINILLAVLGITHKWEKIEICCEQRTVFACASRVWLAVRRFSGAWGGGAAARATAAAAGSMATHARPAHTRLAPAHPARAAQWLADDDIVRFLQALPNYQQCAG
ncbi:unnamed protein product [Colias eurytheme]|nr:unnamed protein product [Colias eurytheme]